MRKICALLYFVLLTSFVVAMDVDQVQPPQEGDILDLLPSNDINTVVYVRYGNRIFRFPNNQHVMPNFVVVFGGAAQVNWANGQEDVVALDQGQIITQAQYDQEIAPQPQQQPQLQQQQQVFFGGGSAVNQPDQQVPLILNQPIPQINENNNQFGSMAEQPQQQPQQQQLGSLINPPLILPNEGSQLNVLGAVGGRIYIRLGNRIFRFNDGRGAPVDAQFLGGNAFDGAIGVTWGGQNQDFIQLNQGQIITQEAYDADLFAAQNPVNSIINQPNPFGSMAEQPQQQPQQQGFFGGLFGGGSVINQPEQQVPSIMNPVLMGGGSIMNPPNLPADLNVPPAGDLNVLEYFNGNVHLRFGNRILRFNDGRGQPAFATFNNLAEGIMVFWQDNTDATIHITNDRIITQDQYDADLFAFQHPVNSMINGPASLMNQPNNPSIANQPGFFGGWGWFGNNNSAVNPPNSFMNPVMMGGSLVNQPNSFMNQPNNPSIANQPGFFGGWFGGGSAVNQPEQQPASIMNQPYVPIMINSMVNPAINLPVVGADFEILGAFNRNIYLRYDNRIFRVWDELNAGNPDQATRTENGIRLHWVFNDTEQTIPLNNWNIITQQEYDQVQHVANVGSAFNQPNSLINPAMMGGSIGNAPVALINPPNLNANLNMLQSYVAQDNVWYHHAQLSANQVFRFQRDRAPTTITFLGENGLRLHWQGWYNTGMTMPLTQGRIITMQEYNQQAPVQQEEISQEKRTAAIQQVTELLDKPDDARFRNALLPSGQCNAAKIRQVSERLFQWLGNKHNEFYYGRAYKTLLMFRSDVNYPTDSIDGLEVRGYSDYTNSSNYQNYYWNNLSKNGEQLQAKQILVITCTVLNNEFDKLLTFDKFGVLHLANTPATWKKLVNLLKQYDKDSQSVNGYVGCFPNDAKTDPNEASGISEVKKLHKEIPYSLAEIVFVIDPQQLGRKYTKAISNIQQEIKTEYDDYQRKNDIGTIYFPLIEALFNSRRGHNVDFNNQAEADRPSCGDGTFYQLLRGMGRVGGVYIQDPGQLCPVNVPNQIMNQQEQPAQNQPNPSIINQPQQQQGGIMGGIFNFMGFGGGGGSAGNAPQPQPSLVNQPINSGINPPVDSMWNQ